MKHTKSLLVFLAISFAARCQAQIQIMDPAKVAAFRAALPATENNAWQEFFNDPITLFYTSAEMPIAYQHANAGLIVNGGMGSSRSSTFHWALYNISGDNLERQKPHGMGGNANVEFPWRHGVAGGTDFSEGISTTFKMMRLPRRQDGSVHPVVWWNESLPGSRTGPHVCTLWIFPKGTIFAECLVMRDSQGMMHTWEVRLRIRELTYWDIELLKPFVDSAELAKRLEADGYSALAQQLKAPRQIQTSRVLDRIHRRTAFDSTAGVDPLPPLGEEYAKKLLDSTPFSSAVGAVWHRGTNGVDAAAPSTEERFSIVPPRYLGSFIGNDTNSCRNCHKHTLHHVDEFDAQRQWYGRVRGSRDEIFSFLPVEPSSVAPTGGARPVVMRRAFVEAGMLERFDRARHPPDVYSLLSP